MRLRLLVLAAAMLGVLSLPAFVYAYEGENTTDTSTKTSSETKPDNSTLEQRIQKHKDELKAKLTTLQEDRIKLKCKASQGVVKIVGDRVNSGYPVRANAYKELQNKLTDIIAKLKAANIDSATLEQEQATLTTMAQTVKDDVTAYKQELSDLNAMDCTADPTGFKAALETARATHDKLIKDTADLKTYVHDTIKPTLQQIRDQLKTKEDSSNQ